MNNMAARRSRAGDAPGGGNGLRTGSEPLPTGTVTFLFTDIQGSTRLLERLGAETYRAVLDDHRARLRDAILAAGGFEFGTEGDALFAVFPGAVAAVSAAAAAQRALAEQRVPGSEQPGLPVRMGVHTGEATLAGRDYVGLEVHRAARIASAAHGGQVLLSDATRALVDGRLPSDLHVRDLGEHRLKDLSRPEHLGQLLVDNLPQDFPALRTLDVIPNNLPVQVTSFVGRERLVAEARALLESARLLTLTGPGGTGKTRLALQLAADLVDTYPDGVYFVALGPLTDPGLVPATIAQALDLAEGAGGPPMQRLIEALRARRVLLVLDNFEQLLPAAADIAALLRGTGAVQIIVTSRAVLRISGEQELPVPPLALPEFRGGVEAALLSQYEAVQLFIERAVAARPDFQVTNENAPAVAEITARLDGLPLAIELAAARLRVLSPQAILARLGDRLALLSGGARDAPARQQTLRGAIAWSYDLLDPPERDLFERLAVFAGGWTLEAAEALAPATRAGTGGPGVVPAGAGPAPDIDVLDGLTSLAEKSLVKPQDDVHGDARFLMLETIRAFAAERLDARPDAHSVRAGHAAWYLDLAERVGGDELGGRDRRARLNLLEDDHDNMRAALGWFLAEGDLRSSARLAVSLWRFWQMRGHLDEARERVDALLARDDTEGLLAPTDRLALLSAAGGIAYWQGEIPATHERYRVAVDLARQHGSRRELAEALYNFSFAPRPLPEDGDWVQVLVTESSPAVEEAMGIFRELGDRRAEGRAIWALSEFRYFAGDFAGVMDTLQQALTVFRDLDDRFWIAWALHALGLSTLQLGRVSAALPLFQEALDLFVEAGDVSGISMVVLDLAATAKAAGQRDRAIRLAGAAAGLAARTGAGLGYSSYLSSAHPDTPAHPEGGPELAAWEAGERMTADEAVAFARTTPA